jgi:hypothetical protein
MKTNQVGAGDVRCGRDWEHSLLLLSTSTLYNGVVKNVELLEIAMRVPTNTEYALEHLKELHDVLADRSDQENASIPRKNFTLAAQFLKAIGEATLSVVGEPEMSPGGFGELHLYWRPPQAEIHLVIRDGNIFADAYLSTGTQHADNFAEVVKLVHLAAGV